jgi:hypothetical protein
MPTPTPGRLASYRALAAGVAGFAAERIGGVRGKGPAAGPPIHARLALPAQAL